MSVTSFTFIHRKKLLKCIESLSSAASKELVSQTIQNCIHDIAIDIENERSQRDGQEASEFICNNSDEDHSVTPLMIACENCQVEVIQNICSRISTTTEHSPNKTFQLPTSYLIAIFGHPLDTTHPTTCGGNGAAHLIAASNKKKDTDVFDALLTLFEEIMNCNKHDLNLRYKNCSKNGSGGYPSPHELLLSHTNSNKDTPIMMASAMGNINFLSHTLSQNQQRQALIYGDYPDEKKSNGISHIDYIRKLLYMKNNKGDTALKLAFGHGHYDIVKLFISGEYSTKNTLETNENNQKNVRIKKNICAEYSEKNDCQSIHMINGDHVNECQQTLSKVHFALEEMKANWVNTENQKQMKEDDKNWDRKMHDMKKSLILIKITAEKNARLMENELLTLTQKEDEKFQGKTRKETKRSKRKTSRRKNIRNDVVQQNTSVQITGGDEKQENVNPRYAIVEKNRDKEHERSSMAVTKPRFVTLQDGSLVGSSVSKNLLNSKTISDGYDGCSDNPNSSSQPVPNVTKKETSSTTSLQTMLRDRFRATVNDNPSSIENEKLEQLMNSLCLDVSMLLLAPHGMAMTLSPCQLDAVERLLKDQLDAVVEARQIQDRLLSKANDNEQNNL